MRTFAYIIVPLASYLVAHSNAQILSALFGSSPSTTSAPPAALLPSNSASAPNVLSIPTLPTALSLPSALSLPTALTLPTLPTLPSLPSLPSLSLPISLPFPTPTIAPNAFKPNAFRPATNPLLSALGLPQLVITIQWLPPSPGDNSVEHRILTLTHISSDKVLIAIRFNIGRGLARVISGLDDLIPGLNLGDTLGRSGPGVGRRQDVATLSNLLSTTSDSGFIFDMATEIVNRMIQPVVEVTEVEVVKMYAMPVNGSDVAACGNGTSMEWVPMMGSETIGAGSTILTGTGTSVPMTVPGTCNGTEIPMTVGGGSSSSNAVGTSAGLSMTVGTGSSLLSATGTSVGLSVQTGVGAASALSTASMSLSVGAASALSTVAQSGVPLSMQSGMPAGTEATLGTIGQGPANTGVVTPTAAGVGSDSGSGSTSGSGSGSANGAGSGSPVAGSSSNAGSGSSSGSGSDAGVGTSDAGSNSGSNSASGVNNGNGVGNGNGNGNGAGNSNGAGTPPPTPLPTAPPATPSANSIPQHLFYVMTGPATRITRTVYRVTRSGGVATSTGA